MFYIATRRRNARSAARPISALAAIDGPWIAAAVRLPRKSTIWLLPSPDAYGKAVPNRPAVFADTTYALFSMARARLAMFFGESRALATSDELCAKISAPRTAK